MDSYNEYKDIIWKDGNKDGQGRTINKIYFFAEKRYIIYIHEPKNILTYVTFSQEYQSKFNDSMIEISRILSILPTKNDLLLEEAAYGLQQIAEGRKETAIQIFNRIEEKIIIERINIGRFQYFLGVLTLILANIVLFQMFALQNCIYPPSNHYQIFFDAATWGGFGGLLSVCFRLKKMEVDSSLGFMVNYFDGILKALVSMFGSVFIYSAVCSGIILEFLNKNQSNEMFIVITMLGGFSERLLPTAMELLGKQVETKQLEEKDSFNN